MSPSREQVDLVYQVDLLESIRQGLPVRAKLGKPTKQRDADLEFLAQGPRMFAWGDPAKNPDLTRPAYQMYINRSIIAQLVELQSALSKAATNIIGRWFVDEEANFPERMLIQDNEEHLLRWVAASGVVPPYAGRQGCSRPDFLFSAVSRKPFQPVICEINARFPYNSWLLMGPLSAPFDKLGLDKAGLRTGHDPLALEEAIFKLFDSSRPAHVLMGSEWPGFDVHLLPALFKAKNRPTMRIISPADLHLTPDIDSPTGYHLSCTVRDSASGSETQERVWQLSLDIVQAELGAIDMDILKEISRICINDLRSIYLLHDKRFMGIILEEIDNMVEAGTIDTTEARTLREGIAPTYLPGSAGWISAMASDSRDKFILKSAREGVGKGHVFGHSVSQEEWDSLLQKAGEATELVDGKAFALQRRVDQVQLESLDWQGESMDNFHLVGAWAAVNGVYLGTTGMRLAEDLCVPLGPGARGLNMFAVTDVDV
ncbi:hypothetical protein PT974_01300 [Cladobotryum mycophilum]|uniref:Uncharacterized protein n=1 Tax=Cladobotryum mycophilum TaxID=491253 RepID=A0ABR0T4K7_9HYPO